MTQCNDSRREWSLALFGAQDDGPGWRVWARGARWAYGGCRRLGMRRRASLQWVWNARPLTTALPGEQ